MEQALPGDAVDWTEADYHATIGQLYAHISMQQKQINVLRQVRDELMEKIALAPRPMNERITESQSWAYATARDETPDEKQP